MQLGSSETIDFNGMRLDPPGRSLRDASGHEVQLTRGEFAILTALARRPGQVLSRDQLLDAVSGRSADAFDRSIDNLISRLRRKIEPDPKKPRLILSVRGAGYKLSPRPDPGKLLLGAAAVPRCPILVVPFSNLSGGRGDLSPRGGGFGGIDDRAQARHRRRDCQRRRRAPERSSRRALHRSRKRPA